MNERFHKAARDGIVEVLRETTKRDCNAKDEDGMSPTLWAAFEGHLDALRLLVARGGDPDKSDNFGNTALHHSTERGHIACVRFLTNFGANLWSLNCDMHTPKELAAMKNRGDILRFLDEAMAEQEATARKDVKAKKEKAQKEAEKKLKEFEKIKKKAEKYAEKEQKRLEKQREKMGEDCLNQGNTNRSSAVLQALKSKTGVGSLIIKGVNTPSPKFSEIVGTMTEANAKKFGIGAVHKKINPVLFGSQRGEPVRNDDFKVVEIEDGKKSIKNLTGLRRDSEILYVGNYEKEKQNAGTRGKLCDVFNKTENTNSDLQKQEGINGINETILRERASIFERPGFGSFAFRNSLTATLSALPISENNEETKEVKSEECSIGSAGSLNKRNFISLNNKNNQWNLQEAADEDCDIGNVDDIDSLEDEESSPIQLFLISNGLKEYTDRFLAEKIDLESLLMLTEDDLLSLGLPLGPRRKLMTAINCRKEALEQPGKVIDSQL